MQRLRAFLLNLITVIASVAFTLLVIEGALRLFPVAWAPSVEPPSADNPIQRYAASQSFTWSLGWNFHDVVRGRVKLPRGRVLGGPVLANFDKDRERVDSIITRSSPRVAQSQR